MDNLLCNQGIIESIDDKSITVKMTLTSACDKCHGQAVCGAHERKNEMLVISVESPQNFKEGEIVNIELEKRLGGNAVLIAYLLPFLVLTIGLFLTYYITHKELYSALVGFFLTIIYYLIIKRFHKKWENKFTFTISKYKSDINSVQNK